MWLRTRMFLLLALLFGILYGVVTGIGVWVGAGSTLIYIILAFVFRGIQSCRQDDGNPQHPP